MTSERVLRFEVPSREALDRLIAEPLPLGLEGKAAELDFFRDLYYDTPEGDLAKRGAVVRLRIRRDGSSTLTVDLREPEAVGTGVMRSRCETLLPGGDLQSGLEQDSECVRVLRAMVDPERLSPQIELETTRRVRPARHEAADVDVLIAYDLITVRRANISTDFHEIELRLPTREVPELDGLVQALEGGAGLRMTLADPRAHAQEVLEAMELRGLERAVRAAREVVVVAFDEGRVAMLRERAVLRFPTGQGSGEDACRRVLRGAVGRTQGQVRLLGTSPGVGTRPALEVWLAQRTGTGAAEDGLAWLPLTEVLESVGSPVVREPRTLAALHALARAGLSRTPAGGERAEAGRGWQAVWQEEREAARHVTAAEEPEDSQPEEKIPQEALLNMDLSELAFQERVLALASDRRVPLLERVRFLSIIGSNIDEFFMTRVAGYKRQVASGSEKLTQDGLTAAEELDAIGIRIRHILGGAYRLLEEEVLPELRGHGIEILRWTELSGDEREYLRDYYSANIDAVLTPLATDPSHPFPHIRNLRPALAVVIRVPESRAEHFAAIELPGDLPRFVPLPGGLRFVPLEEVIQASLPRLYYGLDVESAYFFRVTRSGTLSVDEEGVSDMLRAVEEEVVRRPFRPAVRLEVESSMPEPMRALLLRELQFEARDRVSALSEADIYTVDWLVDLRGLNDVASLPSPELHYPPLRRTNPVETDRPILEVMREREVLVRFPYDSFEGTVERFLIEAADDPDVLSLKITLYRTNRSSRIVDALRRARQQGKEVVALIELKASFDEQRNIEWARSLEAAGIHVIFGPSRLKVHAKIALVVRREGEGVRRYFYIGTGNLNAATAAGYTDLGLLSSDPALGEDLNDVFNQLTGYSGPPTYRHLLVAPFDMRANFLRLIDREAEHALAGRGGRIRAKINGLTDRGVVAALYRASRAGVEIDLVVRGICALRPGVPGLSANIRVISILGRFLEHSRIYRFDNAGEPEFFIGSADWRPRNLARRVEVVTPVWNPDYRATLDEILESCLAHDEAWELHPDGSYHQRGPLAAVARAAARAVEARAE